MIRSLVVAVLILAAGIILGGLLLAALLSEPMCVVESASCVPVMGA